MYPARTVITPPVRSSSLPTFSGLPPERPLPTRSNTAPQATTSTPPQLPPLSIPPSFKLSAVVDPFSFSDCDECQDDSVPSSPSTPSLPSSPLLHTQFSISELSLTDSLSLDSESLLLDMDYDSNATSDDLSKPTALSIDADGHASDDTSAQWRCPYDYECAGRSLRSWLPRSMTTLSLSESDSYFGGLETTTSTQVSHDKGSGVSIHPPPRLSSLTSRHHTTSLHLQLHTFPTFSPSFSSGLTSIPTTPQSAFVSTRASTPAFPALHPMPMHTPATAALPQRARTTIHEESRRSSLIRAQSTPALGPSHRRSSKAGRSMSAGNLSVSASPPSRFVSAVRVVMRDLKGLAMRRMSKSERLRVRDVLLDNVT